MESLTPDITTWSRVAQLAGALSDLARETTSGTDTVDMLSRLAKQSVEIIPVTAAGILVVDQFSLLKVIGSSSDAAHLLDLYQVQNKEGPCLVCLHTGVAVSLDDLAAPGAPWPHFRVAATREGFRSVYALPLRAKGTVLGALNLFSDKPLTELELAGAQALADAATMTLLRADPTEDGILVARRLQAAVETRNGVEQAKGMLAQRYGLDIASALHLLVDVAERAGVGVTVVARHVTNRGSDKRLDQLLIQTATANGAASS
jgi:hypothetical protein